MAGIKIDGAMLRQVREAQRWSQGDLGKRVGKTYVWIGKLERQQEPASLAILDALARVFGKRVVGEMIPDPRDRATFNRKVWRPDRDDDDS